MLRILLSIRLFCFVLVFVFMSCKKETATIQHQSALKVYNETICDQYFEGYFYHPLPVEVSGDDIFCLTSRKKDNLIIPAGSWMDYVMDPDQTHFTVFDLEGNKKWSIPISEFSGSFYRFRVFCFAETVNHDFLLACSGLYSSLFQITFPLLIKLDPNGNLLWRKNLDTLNSSYNFATTSVRELKDGRILLKCIEIPQGGLRGSTTIICDEQGNVLTTTPYQPYNPFFSVTYDCNLVLTSDGNTLAPGLANDVNDFCNTLSINKRTINGTDLFNFSYTFPAEIRPIKIIETRHNSYVATGFVNSPAGWDIWMIEISESGNLLKEKTISLPFHEYCTDLLLTDDNGYLVVGTQSSGNSILVYDCIFKELNFQKTGILLKLKSDFSLEWQETLGNGKGSVGNFVAKNTNGYIVLGNQLSHGNNHSANLFFQQLENK